MRYVVSHELKYILPYLGGMVVFGVIFFLISGSGLQTTAFAVLGYLIGMLLTIGGLTVYSVIKIVRLARLRNEPFDDIAYVHLRLGWREEWIRTDPDFYFELKRALIKK